MMRIICPVCGEEPQKGERHVCRAPPVAVPEQTELRRTTETAVAINVASSASGPSIGLQRRGLTATPGAVCASMASLVSKSPSLWKSGKALARSSGEEFVAGLLASAVGCGGWHKDAKRALVVALTGKVHGDAARALQDAWRKHAAARRPPPRVPAEKGPDGYLKLSLPLAAAGARQPFAAPVASTQQAGGSSASAPRARPSSAEQRSRRPPPLQTGPSPAAIAVAADYATAASKFTPVPPPGNPPPPSPRNKSNPRPTGGRGVPSNPIQAMKQRKVQQQQELEEKKLKGLEDAEEERLRRVGSTSTGTPASSIPSSPQGSTGGSAMLSDLASAIGSRPPTMPDHVACGDILDTAAFALVPSTDFCEAGSGGDSTPQLIQRPDEAEMLTPLERRKQRQVQDAEAASAAASAAASTTTAVGGEAQSGWRPQASPRSAAAVPASPRSSLRDGGAQRAVSASPSATERLMQRMRQREQKPAGDHTPRSSSKGAATSDWQVRIESRQREVETQQVEEAEERRNVAERTSRRNDAMRRVVERQAERQQDVAVLEA